MRQRKRISRKSGSRFSDQDMRQRKMSNAGLKGAACSASMRAWDQEGNHEWQTGARDYAGHGAAAH
jgi:hypothetical protein